MEWLQWYDTLAKPSWTPDPDTIRVVWAFLYPVIGVSFGVVFLQYLRGKLPGRVALPFALNLVTNLAFMPLFVGLRSVPISALDIVAVWVTLVWAMAAVWPHLRWVTLAQVPYLVWVTIATTLQLSILAMNLSTI